jgi:hypothetical protein
MLMLTTGSDFVHREMLPYTGLHLGVLLMLEYALR